MWPANGLCRIEQLFPSLVCCIDLSASADLVAAVYCDLIAIVQVTKDFDHVADLCSGLDINPFGFALANTNDESPLQVAGNR
jgi:hypothetical protein